MQTGKDAYVQEINRLRKQLDQVQKSKNLYDTDTKARFNSDLENIKKDYQSQIDKLTETIKNLSVANKELQDRCNRNQVEESRLKDQPWSQDRQKEGKMMATLD